MPNIYPQASVIKRLAALIYDALIVLAICFVYGWSVLIMKYKFFNVALPANGRAELGSIEGVGLVLILIFFFSFFWHRGGQTLGMKTWQLKLMDQNGSSVSWQKCLLRCTLAPITLTVGYIWGLFDRDKKCLQDRLSGTQVVEVPK